MILLLWLRILCPASCRRLKNHQFRRLLRWMLRSFLLILVLSLLPVVYLWAVWTYSSYPAYQTWRFSAFAVAKVVLKTSNSHRILPRSQRILDPLLGQLFRLLPRPLLFFLGVVKELLEVFSAGTGSEEESVFLMRFVMLQRMFWIIWCNFGVPNIKWVIDLVVVCTDYFLLPW